MSEVSVNSQLLAQLIELCKKSMNELSQTSNKLLSQYKDLGSTWKDNKYKEFGDIINNCCSSLKKPLGEMERAVVYLRELMSILKEYESISLGSIAEGGNSTYENNTTNSYNSSISGFIQRFFGNLFGGSKNIYKALKGVEYRAINKDASQRTEQQIINNISGGDMTEGSCSSLAFAYAGNRAGYIVYDFRDGRSREVFSLNSSIEQIANIEGVNSVILHGRDDSICAEQLMSNMERGREYYMATGAHAAIVRLNNEGHYQYLELQSGIPEDNGWQPLTLSALYDRFGCVDGQSNEYPNYLIELESLQNNSEFINLLGYINTAESSQIRGVNGHER